MLPAPHPPLPPQLPRLYSFRRCPYAIRARLALHASGQTVAVQEVSLRAKPAELLALSPKGTVPVLQLPDGRVLDQSLDIMRWALQTHDPHAWLAGVDAPEAQALIALNDGPFKRLLDAYKYPQRHPSRPASAWRDEAVALVLAPLDARLRQHAQLMGPNTTLVDMALLPFVRQFAKVDEAWFAHTPLRALQAWLGAHLASASFMAVMQPGWPAPGDTPPRSGPCHAHLQVSRFS
jgi:glutathione S-transferase